VAKLDLVDVTAEQRAAIESGNASSVTLSRSETKAKGPKSRRTPAPSPSMRSP
jgi:hypothetical protein